VPITFLPQREKIRDRNLVVFQEKINKNKTSETDIFPTVTYKQSTQQHINNVSSHQFPAHWIKKFVEAGF